MKRVIVWFRQDLRLHDNEALSDALSVADELIPIFVFDPRKYEAETSFGFPKTGLHRGRFMAEAVHQLRQSLREYNTDLIVRYGPPEEIIFEIAREYRTRWVFCNRERTPEEVSVQDGLEKRLWAIGQEMRFTRGKMLYHTADLPFPVTHTPDSFVTYRKVTERIVRVRQPIERPVVIPGHSCTLEPGEIPADLMFGGDANFCGGEQHGEAMLDKLLRLQPDLFQRNHESIALSPWIASGCLSPKLIYYRLLGSQLAQSEEATKIVHRLMYRDFLRLMIKKHGVQLFESAGISGRMGEEKIDGTLLNLWIDGRTGVPIIDASMRKLSQTGYLAPKLRQLVATYLVRDLQLSWRAGASYFESVLIDYDIASNWVNWANLAGVGPENREDRPINYTLQSKRLDADGTFIKQWLPELQDADCPWIHEPSLAPESLLKESGITLGKNYPRALRTS